MTMYTVFVHHGETTNTLGITFAASEAMRIIRKATRDPKAGVVRIYTIRENYYRSPLQKEYIVDTWSPRAKGVT